MSFVKSKGTLMKMRHWGNSALVSDLNVHSPLTNLMPASARIFQAAHNLT